MRNPHFDARWWIDTDAAAIENYNRRAGAQYRLHTELGPQPWEGDPLAASIVLLVQNPRWDATSTLDDHVFHREGWPVSSLHPEAPAGMRAWAMGMIKKLVAAYGAQHVSRRVCFLQIHAWASEEFDSKSIDALPSSKANIAMAKAAKERGALLVVRKNDAHWERLLSLPRGTLPHGNGPRKIHLSQNNMRLAPGLWERVRAAME